MLILGRYKKVFEKKTVYLHKFNILTIHKTICT